MREGERERERESSFFRRRYVLVLFLSELVRRPTFPLHKSQETSALNFSLISENTQWKERLSHAHNLSELTERRQVDHI